MMLISFMKPTTSLTSNNCIDVNIKFPRIVDKTNTSVGKKYFFKVQSDNVLDNEGVHNGTLKSQSRFAKVIILQFWIVP